MCKEKMEIVGFTAEKLMKSWGRSAFHFRYSFAFFLEPVADYNFSFYVELVLQLKKWYRNWFQTEFRL